MTPVVSILMAVYNAEAWLPRALDSLQAQTCAEWELLAVDDASTDTSCAILRRYANGDDRIRLLRQPVNQGQAVARNIALRHARGQFVCMLDADDWLSPDALQSALGVFAAHPQTDCVLFRLVYHWQESGREEDFPLRGADPDSVLTGEEAFRLSLGWHIHGLYMVRRELHQRYPYDDHYRLYSDDNTCHLHYLHSRQVRHCRGIYYYRRHAVSTTTCFSPMRFLHMLANYDLQRVLEREGVADEVVARYRQIRWCNYRSLLWLYFSHRRAMNKEERTRVRADFRRLYPTFLRRQPYMLFLADQYARWCIRSLTRMRGRC